jgi:hypothetical protein
MARCALTSDRERRERNGSRRRSERVGRSEWVTAIGILIRFRKHHQSKSI